MPRINNATKRALFNARRRYNNARTRANAVPNSDPEAKNRALNNTMAAARNYLNAVRAASTSMTPLERRGLLPPIPGRQPTAVNVLRPPPLPSVAPAPRATIRNRMRAAISRRYNYNAVSNANVNAFLAGHMEYNDPEINAIYREYQSTHRGGSKKATRKNSRGNYRLDPENNNPGKTNNYNTNVWPVATPSLNEVKAEQEFLETYKNVLEAKHSERIELTKKWRALKASMSHMVPGSHNYMEAHQELGAMEARGKTMLFNEMHYMPVKRNTLKRSLSFANKR